MNRKQIDETYETWPQYSDIDLMCKDFAEYISEKTEKEIMTKCVKYLDSRGYSLLAKDLVRELRK